MLVRFSRSSSPCELLYQRAPRRLRLLLPLHSDLGRPPCEVPPLGPVSTPQHQVLRDFGHRVHCPTPFLACIIPSSAIISTPILQRCLPIFMVLFAFFFVIRHPVVVLCSTSSMVSSRSFRRACLYPLLSTVSSRFCLARRFPRGGTPPNAFCVVSQMKWRG